MHIVIVNDYAYINGGTGKVALTSAIALAERGHAITVFTAVPPIMPELCHPHIQVVNTEQHDILNNPSRMQAVVQGLWNMKAYRSMGDILSSLSPADTIVHLHAWTKALSSSIVRQALSRKFAVVLTLHDYFSACPNGGFYNYRKCKICTLVPLSLRCISEQCDSRSYYQKIWRVMRQILQTRYGLVPNAIKDFISVSRFSEGIMKPYLPQGHFMHYIPNPVEGSQEKMVDAGNNDKLIFVGRLSPEKGITSLVSSAHITGYDITFVGEGPCRQYIESRLPKSSVTGWLAPVLVREHMKTARALIFPSICYETQGLVVQEAASMGVPAIVSDTSSARDLIIDGVTGLLFRGGDDNDLADKIRIIQDCSTAQKLGKAAYERYWMNPPTMEKHLELLEKCYSATLNRHT